MKAREITLGERPWTQADASPHNCKTPIAGPIPAVASVFPRGTFGLDGHFDGHTEEGKAWRSCRVRRFLEDDVIVLVHEAIEFYGHDAAVEQAKRVRRATTRTDWHPWAPGFAWYFSLDLKRTPVEVTPSAGLVARDMRLLQSIPTVLSDPALRREAAERVRTQREAALEELRAAGLYSAAGVRAEWSAVTKTDIADVLLSDDGVEFQMKTRAYRQAPLTKTADVNAVLSRIDDARGQLSAGRAGVVVMIVPGVGDWSRRLEPVGA